MHPMRQMPGSMSGKCDNSQCPQQDLDTEQQALHTVPGMCDQMPSKLSYTSQAIGLKHLKSLFFFISLTLCFIAVEINVFFACYFLTFKYG